MKGLENPVYLAALVAFNLLAVFMLWAAVKRARLARLLFFVLFAWAGITNWYIATNNPEAYLNYADLTFLQAYRQIIVGPFADHINLYVGIIATCQAIMAVSMLLKGWIVQLGGMGAIIFLLAIVPLGVGSGFPCTLIMAIAMCVLVRKPIGDYLWVSHRLSTPAVDYLITIWLLPRRRETDASHAIPDTLLGKINSITGFINAATGRINIKQGKINGLFGRINIEQGKINGLSAGLMVFRSQLRFLRWLFSIRPLGARYCDGAAPASFENASQVFECLRYA